MFQGIADLIARAGVVGTRFDHVLAEGADEGEGVVGVELLDTVVARVGDVVVTGAGAGAALVDGDAERDVEETAGRAGGAVGGADGAVDQLGGNWRGQDKGQAEQGGEAKKRSGGAGIWALPHLLCRFVVVGVRWV